MSDEDYAAFLNKANKDYSGPSTKPSAEEEGISARAHPAIKALGEVFYSSDADYPFIDVTFPQWGGGGLPDEAQFGKLIEAEEEDVEKLSLDHFDSTGAYRKVIDAVQDAAGGADAAVYRYTQDHVRKWYYVLAQEKSQNQLVGVKVQAIES
ncbi:hypothetical protein H072_960 [Dactylellina haptotyla CBS 200.50]|uniref:Uncharacterized protein n=1 Tax=Dactylellina haptotyla (strain CBS 200.50) TaxID=1284197 RepID=S8CB86_DACHA|nr:hypothetical protein H072_960 [Dactylellina haptotyla CBS 200.50]